MNDIFESLKPEQTPVNIDTLSNGTMFYISATPAAITGKGRKNYTVTAVTKGVDGVVTEGVLLVITETHRAVFAANPFQLKTESGLTGLVKA